jgi:hypothetical protein
MGTPSYDGMCAMIKLSLAGGNFYCATALQSKKEVSASGGLQKLQG